MINKAEILKKFSRREVSSGEHRAFLDWIHTLSPTQLDSVLNEYGDIIAGLPDLQDQPDLELLTSVHASINKEETITATIPAYRSNFIIKWRWVAAAVLVLAVSTIVLVLQNRKQSSENTRMQVADVPPGANGAILTLANGKQVVLDSLTNGIIAIENGSDAVLENGKLIYNANAKNDNGIAYNTMSTPKGRQFHVVLPDGTTVWLNAASSISYPTVFRGKERIVKLKGEAYFEVAKNAKIPFHVDVNDKNDIEVLGTNFNVDAYSNNKEMVTTLLEGSIKINGTLIKPGQQAKIGDVLKVIDNADISKVVAWKNGLFNFEGASLDEVMKQLERWYDIEVVYEKGIPDIEFGGEMTKNISLNGLLLILEKSDIHFRLEGRKLIVLP